MRDFWKLEFIGFSAGKKLRCGDDQDREKILDVGAIGPRTVDPNEKTGGGEHHARAEGGNDSRERRDDATNEQNAENDELEWFGDVNGDPGEREKGRGPLIKVGDDAERARSLMAFAEQLRDGGQNQKSANDLD